MMRGDHPLAQLFELGMLEQRLAELGLAEQQGLQQRMRTELEVRQHAQLFERADRQVLRFIDDQQAAPTGAGFLVEEAFDRAQRRRLVMAFDQQAESLRHDMHQLFAVELAGDDLGGGQPGRIDSRHQMRDQRGFARADFAGDDDKAFALRQTIAQIGQRLAVRQAFEIESRIRRQLERSAFQPIEIIEHRVPPFEAQNVYRTTDQRRSVRLSSSGSARLMLSIPSAAVA